MVPSGSTSPFHHPGLQGRVSGMHVRASSKTDGSVVIADNWE